MDELLEKIWEKLDLIRIYTKPKVNFFLIQGQVPDYDAPVILSKKRNKVEDFCTKIHRGLLKEFKYATVWGTSVKHQPMKVCTLLI